MTALRALRWPDLTSVARIERVAFPLDPWTEATFWAELALRPRRHYLVAADDRTVLGYAGLDLADDVADVMTVAVAPQARGSGLGTRLLRALLTHAADRGAARVMLEVRADNGPALGLYRRQGFAPVRRRRRYYRDGTDALVLVAGTGQVTR